MKEDAYIVHTVRFQLYEVQEQTKLSYDKSQIFIASGKVWREEINWKGTGRNFKKI